MIIQYTVYLLAFLWCGISLPLTAISPIDTLSSTPRISITTHKGIYNGKSVSFKAIVKETFLSLDGKESTGASIISTSYIMQNAENPDLRPVMFIFNGGPGASSSPLQMYAFGPNRIIKNPETQEQHIENNPFSPIDVVDLVFIDPPGTGFTRTSDTVTLQSYWGLEQDANAIKELIKAWKKDNNRSTSPLYICGESYGATRASEILGLETVLPVAGILFISASIDHGLSFEMGNDAPYLYYLPSMASLAWHHQKTERMGRSVATVFKDGAKFAQTEYLQALKKGENLSSIEKEKVAAKLSCLIGLDKQHILESNLRISPQEFQTLLLADRGERIGQLDGRITTPIGPVKDSLYHDPSLSSAPIDVTRSLFKSEIITRYYFDSLEFSDENLYVTLNFIANNNWQWPISDGNSSWTVAPFIAYSMKIQPEMRLFVSGGYYDLATPLFGVQYILDKIGIPQNRITYADFETGHSVYDDQECLKTFTQEIRTFISRK